MRRAVFFAMSVACGSPAPVRPEVAQPLPTASVTASTSAPPPVIAVDDARDDLRDLRAPPRSRQIVQQEAVLLTRLLDATDTASPERPKLLHRLADAYAELRKTGEPTAASNAMGRYAEVLTKHPTYVKIDEVRYYLGLEQELRGLNSLARVSYFDLIKNSPTSRFVPYAYYAFGEMFLDEGKTDPTKLALAEQAYMETIKLPSPTIANAARCRLAHVLDAQGKTARAESMRQSAHDCGAL